MTLVIPPLWLAAVAAFAYAAAARPLLRVRGTLGSVLAAIVAIGVLGGPLLIPSEKVLARALAAVVCGDQFFKMIDYARQFRSGRRGSWGDYVRFLIPFPAFLVIYGWRDRVLTSAVSFQFEVARIVVGSAVFATFLFAMRAGIVGVTSSFLVDHLLKVAIFVVTIEALSQALYGVERLCRYDTTPLMRFIVLSRTPLDFWTRYNTRVHTWLDRNVFRPCGGRRAPVRGVLATFFMSAVFHELMFGIATSRFDGTQFTFFMIQAPAVLISPRLEHFARRRGVVGSLLARGLTAAWMAATSVLFFHGVNRVFPFVYASQPWLP